MRVDVDKSELGATTDYGLPVDEQYYKYVLIHVDNLMVESHISEQVMHAIIKTCCLKKYNKTGLPYGPPDIYIVAQICRYQEPEGGSEHFC